MLPSASNRIPAVSALLMAIIVNLGTITHVHAEWVRIKAKLEDGSPVRLGYLCVKDFSGTGECDETTNGVALNGIKGTDEYEIWHEECVKSKIYFAYAEQYNLIGVIDEIKTCDGPPFTFVFKKVKFASYLTKDGAFARSETWESLLTSGAVITSKAEELPINDVAGRMAEYVKTGNYGMVSAAASEWATALRNSNNAVAGEFFSRLSYDAAITGTVAAEGIEIVGLEGNDGVALLSTTRVGKRNKVEFTPEGTDFLKRYQTERLGLQPGDSGFNVVGWNTMKSLTPNQKIESSEYKLPADVNAKIWTGSTLDPNLLDSESFANGVM